MDNKLKQRLIGASVLVALGVIIIPELIKDPFEQTDPVVTINAPRGAPEKSGLTISLPAAEPPSTGQEASAAVEDTPREVTPPPKPQMIAAVSAENAPPPETTPPLAPSSTPKPVPAKPPTPPQEVQTAQVATPPPAPAPTKPPEPKSPPQATAKSPTPPAPKPPEQSSSAPKTDKKPTLSPPSKTIPGKPIELPKIQLVGRSISAAPPKTTGGWTVQAGSFSSEANARALSAKLRNQRFPASVEQVKVNNRISYRVQVGKQASRTESEKMLARMEREAGVKGQVMPTSN